MIKNLDIFKGMSPVEQAMLLGSLEKIDVAKDEVLFNQGDEGDSLYIVLEGNIELFTINEDNIKYKIATLGEGEVFGEMALLTKNSRTASAVSTEASILYKMNRDTFNKVIEEKNTFSLYLIQLLSSRLAKSNKKLQKSEDDKIKVVMEEINKLSNELQLFLLSAALVPVYTEQMMLDFFSEKEYKDKIDSFKNLYIFFIDWNEDKRELKIDFRFRAALSQEFLSKYGIDEKNKVINYAIKIYQEQNLDLYYLQCCSENDKWKEIEAIIEKDYEKLLINEYSNNSVMLYLENCPEEIVIKNYKVLMLLLRYYYEKNYLKGFRIIEDAIFKEIYSFSREERIKIYETAANYCKKLGFKEKVMEYMNRAVIEAHGLENRTIKNKEKKSENGERAFKIAGMIIGEKRGIGMAENARKIGIHKKGTATIILLMISALIIVYFNIRVPFSGLSREAMLFIAVTISGILFWSANLVSEYIVALFLVMGWTITGAVNLEESLSGFSNPAWIYMVSIFAFGAAVSKSGLLYRNSLYILRFFPKNYIGQMLGIAVSGILLTPFIPSSTVKTALSASIAKNISDAMGFEPKSRGSAGLALGAMLFYGYSSAFFLTGSYVNIMALGLVKGSGDVTWLKWILYSMPAFFIFCTASFAAIIFLFKPKVIEKKISTDTINEQLEMLGRTTYEEKYVAITGFVVIIMMLLQPIHGISNILVMLFGILVLLCAGVIDSSTMKTEINWPFLLFIGISFSFVNIFNNIGLSKVVTEALSKVFQPLMVNEMVFLLSIAVGGYILSFVIRDEMALILLTIAIVPIALQMGILPWCAIFIILLTTEPFFFPYQSATYLTAYYSSEAKMFDHSQGRKVALFYAVIIILAIFVSVIFWEKMGLVKT